MRYSRLVRLTLVLAILIGASFLYPTTLQAQTMCGSFAIDITYWDPPDANGNCPIDPTVLVGEYWQDCDGNYGQWGIQGGCNIERSYTYCGDCVQQ